MVWGCVLATDSLVAEHSSRENSLPSFTQYDDVMIRAIAIIGAAALAVGVIIYSFFDCLRSDPRDIRGIKRGPWLAVIVLVPIIGGILWLALGRPRYHSPRKQAARSIGPDDDPDFLRQLDEKRRSEKADAELDAWEKRRQSEHSETESNEQADNSQSPDDENPHSP